MSWANWFQQTSTRSNNPNFTEEARARRIAELEANRLLRAQKTAQRKALLKAAVSAPSSPSFSRAPTPNESDYSDSEDTRSLPDIFLIATDIFEDLHAIMTEDFEVENGADAEKAMEQLQTVKCPFMIDDIEFWFGQLEGQLTVIGIKSQWAKRVALQRFLPPEIQLEVKGLLRLLKSQSGTDIYKYLKD